MGPLALFCLRLGGRWGKRLPGAAGVVHVFAGRRVEEALCGASRAHTEPLVGNVGWSEIGCLRCLRYLESYDPDEVGFESGLALVFDDVVKALEDQLVDLLVWVRVRVLGWLGGERRWDCLAEGYPVCSEDDMTAYPNRHTLCEWVWAVPERMPPS